MVTPSIVWRAAGLLLALMIVAVAPRASACTVSPSVTTTFTPSYSPAALKAGVVPALPSRAGLVCPTAVLTLLGGNYIRAKFKSDNLLKLKRQGGTETIAYTASADKDGTVPFGQNVTVDYMQNNLLNLLGLLGGSSADLPIWAKPAATASLMPSGTYTDRITINWSWYQCPGIGLFNLCVGIPTQGTGTTTLDLFLDVAPRGVTMSIATVTTWDPINGTLNPKALPGSKRRLNATVANPDLVATDSDELRLVIPTPPGTTLALDGDGTGGAVIRMNDGSPSSTLAIRYGAPADAADDIDFSTDGGTSWTFAPQAGNAASWAQVTHVRLRPRGAMAKESSFTVSIPYRIRP